MDTVMNANHKKQKPLVGELSAYAKQIAPFEQMSIAYLRPYGERGRHTWLPDLEAYDTQWRPRWNKNL